MHKTVGIAHSPVYAKENVMNQKIKTLIEELVENCQLNLLVSSPAGSGKTQKLTDRYVSILSSFSSTLDSTGSGSARIATVAADV